jgi:hypothetical protein
MNLIPLIFQLAAAFCFACAAFSWFVRPRAPQWGWLGMLLAIISLMISGIEIHSIAGTR